MQHDYTKQLAEIASALNRPAMPTWIVALIAAAVGSLLTFGSQMLIRVIDNWWEIRRFRRVLYRDIAALFRVVAGAEHFESEKAAREVLSAELQFDAEEYLKREQKIYMQLPDRLVASEIYARLRAILPSENSVRARASIAATHIARQVWEGKLRINGFKDFLDKRDAETLLTHTKEVYDEYTEYAARKN